MIEDDLLSKSQHLMPESRPLSLTEPLFAAEQMTTGISTQVNAQKSDAHTAVNPLVAAASPLLTLKSQLSGQQSTPDIKLLQDKLSNAVKQFENKAHALGYRAPIILAARYFLCTLLDETILNTSWGKDSDWQAESLLKIFQRENSGSERFFVILERACEDPKLHIDLLELAYLCLSLGFEGKYRGKPQSHLALRQILDNVYHLIRYVRGDFSKCLLVSPHTGPEIAQDKHASKKRFRLPPTWVATTIAVIALAGIYLPYRTHLIQLAKPVAKMIETVPFTTDIVANSGNDSTSSP